jgi:hypothetical protein
MPEIVRLDNCSICVYAAGEHPPPHFHILGPNTRVSVDMVTLAVMRGHRCDRKDLKQAREWASDPKNRQQLMDEWRRLNERD